MADSLMRRIVDRVLQPLGFGEIYPADPRRNLRYLPLPVQTAGVTLTMEGALQLSVVWACIDVITKAICSSNWKVYQSDKRNRNFVPDDPLNWLLNTRPNPEMTAISWRESMLYQTISWGNGYSEIVKNNAGKVMEVWPLFSDRVFPRRLYDPYTGHPTDLVYDVYQFSGGIVTLPDEQVLHFKGPSINGVIGENMIARAAKAIGLASAAERFASSYFANGTIVGTVLKYPKTLTAAAHERLKDDWVDRHSGPDKANRPVILEGGMDITTIQVDPEKMDLINIRKFSLEEVCRFFGVPPYKVGQMDRATFNNIEQLGMEFVRDSLTPWALRLEQEVDFKLLPQKMPWRHTKLDLDWLTHGDAVSRATAYQTLRRMGVYSANDILEKEGRNTIGPEGDIRLVESTMTTLDGIEAQVLSIKIGMQKQGFDPDTGIALEKSAAEGGGGDAGEGNEGVGGGAPADPNTPDEEPVSPTRTGAPIQQRSAPAFLALSGALHMLATGALERYTSRLRNLRKDLERREKTADDVEARMTLERGVLQPALVKSLEEIFALAKPLPGGAYLTAIYEVDGGKLPEVVAERLVQLSLETGEKNGAQQHSNNGEDVPRIQPEPSLLGATPNGTG